MSTSTHKVYRAQSSSGISEGAFSDGSDINSYPSSEYPTVRNSSGEGWSPDHANTIIHKLYEKELSSDQLASSPPSLSVEPAVVFRADVYDAKSEHLYLRSSPVATYYSDSPFKISIKDKRADRLPTTEVEASDDDKEQGTRRLRWNGSVFVVCCETFAHFPLETTVEDITQSKRNRPTHKTDDLESLSFTKVARNSIEIVSPYLRVKLRDIAGYYPSLYDVNTDAVRIDDPWCVLLHQYPNLEAFSRNILPDDSSGESVADTSGKDILSLEKEHVGYLCDFLKARYEASVLPCIKKLQMKLPSVDFDMLWYVFKPGTDVYIRAGTSYQACVVMKINYVYDMNEQSSTLPSSFRRRISWMLDLWYLESNGENIGRTSKIVFIDAYEGAKELISLAACPVTVWDIHDNGKRRSMIIERSKLLFKSLRQGHLLADYEGPVVGTTQYYKGTILVDCKRGSINSPEEPPTIGEVNDHCYHFEDYDNIWVNGEDPTDAAWITPDESPVIPGGSHSKISVAEWSHMATTGTSKTEPLSRPLARYQSLPTSKGQKGLTTELSDHQMLLLFPLTRAFALKTKQWMTIEPDYITEMSGSDESIDNLVLGEAEIATIRALSTRQNSKRQNWAADFIEGKGTGQIILLHGPPGVGKTYTVEAVAEFLNRPLLSLTVADIGTVETQVERELIRWFSLAEAWNAVLLVDEADIFLERRQNRDLARNGLVSAFLRRMEYFKGLLFLTTNRVGQIDDAFISRVHVAIGYQALSSEYRSRIWQGFFRKLAKEQAGKIQISPGARKWVLDTAVAGRSQLNGRDIRNALQTAITLAEAEYEEDPDFDPEKMTIVVDKSHFERVVDISNKFHTYVESIRREDERKRAAARFDRNDYWEGTDD